MTIKSVKELQTTDLEKIAKAVEADAGRELPGLRESFAEAAAGRFAAVHTPEMIAARKGGRPDTVKENPKGQ